MKELFQIIINTNETICQGNEKKGKGKKTRIGTNSYHRCRVKVKHEDGCSYGVTNELMVKGPLCTHPFLINHLK